MMAIAYPVVRRDKGQFNRRVLKKTTAKDGTGEIVF
jgi:hypothetical protein